MVPIFPTKKSSLKNVSNTCSSWICSDSVRVEANYFSIPPNPFPLKKAPPGNSGKRRIMGSIREKKTVQLETIIPSRWCRFWSFSPNFVGCCASSHTSNWGKGLRFSWTTTMEAVVRHVLAVVGSSGDQTVKNRALYEYLWMFYSRSATAEKSW